MKLFDAVKISFIKCLLSLLSVSLVMASPATAQGSHESSSPGTTQAKRTLHSKYFRSARISREPSNSPRNLRPTATMEDLALILTRLGKNDLPVQDKTGLSGRYDFTLTWYGYDNYPITEISDL
jgi:uncharacterized protein (TIGR03435 family)